MAAIHSRASQVFFSILGAAGDLSLIGEVFHRLQREGGPGQVGCQILKDDPEVLRSIYSRWDRETVDPEPSEAVDAKVVSGSTLRDRLEMAGSWRMPSGGAGMTVAGLGLERPTRA